VWLSAIAIYNSTSSTTLSVSGATVFGTTGSGTTANTLTTIGAINPSTNTFMGWIGEIAIWNRNLFEIERSSLESYLRTKWAI